MTEKNDSFRVIDAHARVPFRFAYIESDTGPLNKTLKRGSDGIEKTPSADLYRGRTTTKSVDSLYGFAAELQNLPRNAVISLGQPSLNGEVPSDGSWLNIVTDAKFKNQPHTITRSKSYFAFPRNEPGLILFDVDNLKDEHTVDDVLAIFFEIDPQLENAGLLIKHSSSSFIFDPISGEYLTKEKGIHVFAIVNDASRIPSYMERFCARAWELGYGHIEVSKAGSLLVRQIVDATVASPERLIFEAAPTLIDGLEQHVPDIRVIDGGVIDPDAIPEPDWKRVKELQEAAKEASKPQQERVKKSYVKKRVAQVLKHDPKADQNEVEKAIVRTLESGLLQEEDILHFDQFGTVLVKEVLQNGARFDQASLADPLEPDYGSGRCLAKFYWNNGKNSQIHSFAHGSRVYKFASKKSSKGTVSTVPDDAKHVFKALDGTTTGFISADDEYNQLYGVSDLSGFYELKGRNDDADYCYVTTNFKNAKTINELTGWDVCVVETEGDLEPIGEWLQQTFRKPQIFAEKASTATLKACVNLKIDVLHTSLDKKHLKQKTIGKNNVTFIEQERMALNEEFIEIPAGVVVFRQPVAAAIQQSHVSGDWSLASYLIGCKALSLGEKGKLIVEKHMDADGRNQASFDKGFKSTQAIGYRLSGHKSYPKKHFKSPEEYAAFIESGDEQKLCLFGQSPGSGKTEFNNSALDIVQKRSLTAVNTNALVHEAAKKQDGTTHQDGNAIHYGAHNNRVVTTVNSMSRPDIKSFSKSAEIVIFDELVSDIETLATSSAFKEESRVPVYTQWKQLLSQTKTIIAADANMNDLSIDALHRMNPDLISRTYEIEFDYKKYEKPELLYYTQGLFGKADQMFSDKANGLIKDALWMSSASIKMAKKLTIAAQRKGLKVLSITGDDSGDIPKDVLSDLESYAPQVDVIIATGVISSGVSLKKNIHEEVLLFGGQHISPTFLVQMGGRCRCIKKLFVELPPPKFTGDFISSEDHCAYFTDCHDLDRLHLNVKHLHSEAAKQYDELTLRLFVKQGYKITVIDAESSREMENEAKVEADKIQYAGIVDAGELSDLEYQRLNEKDSPTAKESYQLEKAKLHRTFAEDVTADNVRELYRCGKAGGSEVLRNMEILETSKPVLKQLDAQERDTGIIATRRTYFELKKEFLGLLRRLNGECQRRVSKNVISELDRRHSDFQVLTSTPLKGLSNKKRPETTLSNLCQRFLGCKLEFKKAGSIAKPLFDFDRYYQQRKDAGLNFYGPCMVDLSSDMFVKDREFSPEKNDIPEKIFQKIFGLENGCAPHVPRDSDISSEKVFPIYIKNPPATPQP